MAKDIRLDDMTIDEVLNYDPIKIQIASSEYKEDELKSILKDYEKQRSEYFLIAQEYAHQIGEFKGVHSIRFRVKSVGSLCEKILRKRDPRRVKITVDNYTIEIQDLIGIRALYVFPDEFSIVYKQIYQSYSNIFDGNPEVRYRKGDNLDIFKQHLSDSRVNYAYNDDYRSIHYMLHHQNPDVRVEIQTRTVFEEGWSEINHRTVYGMEQAHNANLLRVLSPVLSRMVGTCNEISSLIYSIAYREDSQDIGQAIDELNINDTSEPSLVDMLRDYINTL